MKDLSNENVIHINKNGIQYIQFKRLLQYKNITHCFTLKPLNFAGYDTYELKKNEVDKAYTDICRYHHQKC